MEEFLVQIQKEVAQLKKSKEIILFGAKYMGGVAYKALSALGITPVCFCDNDTLRYNQKYYGVNIISPKEAAMLYPNGTVIYCLLNPNNEDAAKSQMQVEGISKSISHYALLYIYLTLATNRGFTEEQAGKLIYTLKTKQSNSLIFENIAVFITTICSLNCDNCSAQIPFFTKNEHFSKEIFFNSIDAMLTNIDASISLGFSGGEALFHPDIVELCRYASQYKNVLNIRIAENGVSIPKKVDFKALGELGVAIDLRDYGTLSKAKNEFIKICEENNIIYNVINDTTEWTECKPFVQNEQTSPIRKRNFDYCFFGEECSVIINNGFYTCSTIGYSNLIYKEFSANKKDYVDLENSTNIREDITALLKRRKTLSACDYCGVDPSKKVPVGLQIKKGN